MNRDEKTWWQSIDERPGDLLLLGQFADWLQERQHDWGTAMRFAYEKQLVPVSVDHFTGVVSSGPRIGQIINEPVWRWVSETLEDDHRVIRKPVLPAWLKPRGGWRWYKSPSTAYQSYCKRFYYWEKYYPLKFAKLTARIETKAAPAASAVPEGDSVDLGASRLTSVARPGSVPASP
jgi:hypothetical protein